MSPGRMLQLRLLLLVGLSARTFCVDLPAAPDVGTKPSTKSEPLLSAADAPQPAPRRANAVLGSIRRAVAPPLKAFREAPPITRSFVSASIFLSLLSATGVVDMRTICFSERAVLRRGEWWRMLTTFLYMGDQLMSLFYWMQIYYLWECLKMLELVKYHWEPSGFVKMIVCNAVLLMLLKQFRKETIFLSSPLVMTFMYMYSREYEAQLTNFLGFFQIRCGWLPFVQMAQDLFQTGDVTPALLGLISGHLYFYFEEVAPRLLMPTKLPTLAEFMQAGVARPAGGATDSEGEIKDDEASDVKGKESETDAEEANFVADGDEAKEEATEAASSQE